MPFLNAHLMVRIMDVKLGKIPGTQELIECLSNQWQGLLISLHNQVEAPRVDAEAKAPIFLWHKEYGSTSGRGGWMNSTARQMLPEILPQDIQLLCREIVCRASQELPALAQIN
jgi:hypothetical protein